MTDHLPDFPLTHPGKLSQQLVQQNITSFRAAVAYLGELPYQRLASPRDFASVLAQRGGTFTARHALLAQLAREQGVSEVSLVLGVVNFNRERWPAVDQILNDTGLLALPEVRGCLKYRQQLLSTEEPSGFKQGVVSAIEIAPVQIGNFKRRYHLNYLRNWLQLEKLSPSWTLDQLWQVREKCLAAIARHWNQRRQPLAAY